jgi:hypothetical protein
MTETIAHTQKVWLRMCVVEVDHAVCPAADPPILQAEQWLATVK